MSNPDKNIRIDSRVVGWTAEDEYSYGTPDAKRRYQMLAQGLGTFKAVYPRTGLNALNQDQQANQEDGFRAELRAQLEAGSTALAGVVDIQKNVATDEIPQTDHRHDVA